ncbi:phage head closure protein [Paenibacillus radicis (ex Xue et al. 2023)]|uniref:Phage head closure protein n=1 Tax=Paenibacillus radicis (ex Xue et al. 2023) TaxID=2972489 RepID=A0ABT1YSS4_9BACL|nr:phage head closure protein [Paenibacillus radicis (ex Xue et al. 2023)]MCR8635750.1 phage head closure protein [Paenibacillus radicis (ex Xue et al. 2023)]
MRFDKQIYLISVTTGVNDVGDPITIRTPRETFAEKKSVRQSEFYQAAAAGLKPVLTFTVWTLEYAGETELEFEGTTYTIARTFEKNDKEMELVCSGLVVR